MSVEELKNSPSLTTTSDGFEGYSDHIEGNESPQQRGLIRGTRLTFNNVGEWETPDGETVGGDVKLIATNIIRAVVKWGAGADKKPPEETIEVPPGRPFPDIEAMNNAIPKDQWRQGPAGLQGPWQAQQLVVMIEPRSMDTFTYVTSTVGGGIAVRDLVDQVKTMRRYRGQVSPIVTLGDAPMRTRFGERRRPHFTIVDWVHMAGAEEPAQAALPSPETTAVIEAEPLPKPEPSKEGPAPAAKAAKTRKRSGSFDHVAPLSTKEELNDEIPW
jgi:hypothetical protein